MDTNFTKEVINQAKRRKLKITELELLLQDRKNKTKEISNLRKVISQADKKFFEYIEQQSE